MNAAPEPWPEPREPLTPRQRLGVALILAGIGLVLVGVFHVLNAAEGETPARTFAQRRSYNQVKVAVHETFPIALLWGAAGVGVALLGGRLVRRPAPSATR